MTQEALLDRAAIELIVLEVLAERWGPTIWASLRARWSGTPVRRPSMADNLVGDVWGDSDDAAYFIMEVERRTAIDVPQAEWRTVYTLGDVVEKLCSHHRPLKE